MPPNARHFASLELRGPDAADFLQGYLTADLARISVETALPMAYCNIKGRVHASGWVVGEQSRVRLVVHASVAEGLAADLGRYLVFAKSKLSDPAPSVSFSPRRTPDAVALPPTMHFATFGAEESGHDAFAGACAESVFVVVSESVSQAFLPQMIGLTEADAVSFTKGCYLGQEVVARAEHRGAVKQRLRRFGFEGAPPPVGADVHEAADTGPKIGTIVAVGNGIALAATRNAVASAVAADRPLAALDVEAPATEQIPA